MKCQFSCQSSVAAVTWCQHSRGEAWSCLVPPQPLLCFWAPAAAVAGLRSFTLFAAQPLLESSRSWWRWRLHPMICFCISHYPLLMGSMPRGAILYNPSSPWRGCSIPGLVSGKWLHGFQFPDPSGSWTFPTTLFMFKPDVCWSLEERRDWTFQGSDHWTELICSLGRKFAVGLCRHW